MREHNNSVAEAKDPCGFQDDLTLSVFKFLSPLTNPPGSLSCSNILPTFPEYQEDSPAEAESEDDTTALHTSLEKPTPHRGNTMVHVCWHRNTSVSMVDFSVAVEVSAKAQTCPSSCSSSCPTAVFLFFLSLCCIWIYFSPSLGTVSSCAPLELTYLLGLNRTYGVTQGLH